MAMRADATTSQVKQEGGMIRGSIQPADALRGGVATRGEATTSRGKQKGGAMRSAATQASALRGSGSGMVMQQLDGANEKVAH